VIEKQQVQTLTLNPSSTGAAEQQSQTHHDAPHCSTDHPSWRSNKSSYEIPGISVSLARILGEQVMRSRVRYDE
jgi:hypothetical protein